LITDLLEDTPIDVVKDFIGHQEIKSTLTYKRSRLSEEDQAQVLRKLDSVRNRQAKNFPYLTTLLPYYLTKVGAVSTFS